MKTMRELIDIVADFLSEKTEILLTDGGRKAPCLCNPSKVEFRSVIAKWDWGARALIDAQGNLYLCNRYDMYHYQMCRQLGVSLEDSISFYAFSDYIGMCIEPKPKPFRKPPTREDLAEFKRRVEAKQAQIASNKHILRIYGANVAFRHEDVD